jgi:CRP-like cAMP-binding protein
MMMAPPREAVRGRLWRVQIPREAFRAGDLNRLSVDRDMTSALSGDSEHLLRRALSASELATMTSASVVTLMVAASNVP